MTTISKKTLQTVVRVGAVLGVAIAAGHLVQNIQAQKAAEAPVQPEPTKITQVAAEATPDIKPMPLTATAGDAPAVTLDAPADVAEAPVAMEPSAVFLPVAPVERDALFAGQGDTPALAEPQPQLAAFTDPAKSETPEASAPRLAPEVVLTDCAPLLKVEAAPQAMLQIELLAPCDAGGRVVLRHAGLAFAESLDQAGRLLIDIPALDAAGQVSVLLPDAVTAAATAPLADLAEMRRFAVQWMADDNFQLHAFENGATYGAKGHIALESPISDLGSYLVWLGDPQLDLPMMAMIYSWGSAEKTEVAVEAEVTDLTCGRELLGETLLSEKGAVKVTELTLSMPGCEAKGDILVLNNLLADRTLAQN